MLQNITNRVEHGCHEHGQQQWQWWCGDEGESLITTSQPLFDTTRRGNPSLSHRNSIIDVIIRGNPSSPHYNHFLMRQGGRIPSHHAKTPLSMWQWGGFLVAMSWPFFDMTRRGNPSLLCQYPIFNTVRRKSLLTSAWKSGLLWFFGYFWNHWSWGN